MGFGSVLSQDQLLQQVGAGLYTSLADTEAVLFIYSRAEFNKFLINLIGATND